MLGSRGECAVRIFTHFLAFYFTKCALFINFYKLNKSPFVSAIKNIARKTIGPLISQIQDIILKKSN